MACIFCKIINKQDPADVVYEDDKIIAIKDIYPKARVHLLIIPKKHIASINHLETEDKELMGEMILAAQKVAKDKNLSNYNLLINIGRGAGQVIDHLHLHLMAN